MWGNQGQLFPAEFYLSHPRRKYHPPRLPQGGLQAGRRHNRQGSIRFLDDLVCDDIPAPLPAPGVFLPCTGGVPAEDITVLSIAGCLGCVESPPYVAFLTGP